MICDLADAISVTTMNRLQQALVWIGRLPYCRGFGIQSPTDYRFVRYVINEHWPYYAYEQVGSGDGWLRRKTGQLCLRLANVRQPAVVLDRVGLGDYLSAGCRKTQLTEQLQGIIELAVVPMNADAGALLAQCDERSVVVLTDIYRHKEQWGAVQRDERVVVTFDLYYCGIVLFDRRQSKKNYKVNF